MELQKEFGTNNLINLNMNPLVTIIIGTKNRSKLLPRAINSVLNQSYANIECLIIDCASEDKTPSVVAEITDTRLKYIRLDKDPGRIESLNYGIEASSGSFITFLDDDDEYYKEKVEKQAKLLNSSSEDVGIVYCWTNFFNEKTGKTIEICKNHIEGDVFKYTLEKMSLCSFPALMFRKSALLKVGGFKDRVGYPSDWQMVCRMAQYFKVSYVPEVLIKVNKFHNYEQMSKPTVKKLEFYNRLIKWHIDFLDEFKKGYIRYPSKSLVHIYPLISALAITKRYGLMLRYYLKAIRIKPLSIIPHKKIFSGIMIQIKK